MPQAQPAGTMEPYQPYSPTEAVLDAETIGLSEEITTNIHQLILVYSGVEGETYPDRSIYHYESLGPKARAQQDRILLDDHGVTWAQLDEKARRRYDTYLAMQGERLENAVAARVGATCEEIWAAQIIKKKQSLTHLGKKKLVETIFLGTMTLDDDGTMGVKYTNGLVSMGAALIPPGASHAATALGANQFVSHIVSELAGKIYDDAVRSPVAYEKQVKGLVAGFQHVQSKAVARNAVLLDSALQSSSISAAKRRMRKSMKKARKEGGIRFNTKLNYHQGPPPEQGETDEKERLLYDPLSND